MVANATMPTQAVASVVVAQQVVAILVATVIVMAVVLTTAHPVATSATNSPALSSAPNPVSTSAKKAAVLTPHVATAEVVTVLSNVLHQPTHGTVVTAVAHRVKTPLVKAKVADAGKSVAATTATQHAQHPAVQPVTNLVVALSSSVPAISNPTPLQAKALLASAVVHAC